MIFSNVLYCNGFNGNDFALLNQSKFNNDFQCLSHFEIFHSDHLERNL
jgi:hypothetical protein